MHINEALYGEKNGQVLHVVCRLASLLNEFGPILAITVTPGATKVMPTAYLVILFPRV